MKANSLSMYMHRRKNRYMSAPILLVETSTVNRYGVYLMIWIYTSSLYDSFLVASADWFFRFLSGNLGKSFNGWSWKETFGKCAFRPW